MKECKKIKKLLVAYSADELNNKEMNFVKMHIEGCSGCKVEYNSTLEVFRGLANLEKEDEKLQETINWENTVQKITDNIISPYRTFSRSFSFYLTKWRVLTPVLSSIFFLGLMVGYLLFHSPKPGAIKRGELVDSEISLARIETTLARKEILGYFKQTQLLLTDVMKQCDISSSVSISKQMNVDQIRFLLAKNRYFSQDLNDPQLLSSRNLLRKIEWLLYEILIMNDKISCEQLQRLQKFVQQERLFFKIRLIEKELSSYEV